MNKKTFILPDIEIVSFEAEEKITESGDYSGVNFETLI